jgi:hypothetical protein
LYFAIELTDSYRLSANSTFGNSLDNSLLLSFFVDSFDDYAIAALTKFSPKVILILYSFIIVQHEGSAFNLEINSATYIVGET